MRVSRDVSPRRRCHVWAVVDHPVLETLEVTVERRQRRPQLVGHVADKLQAAPFGRLEGTGHLVEG